MKVTLAEIQESVQVLGKILRHSVDIRTAFNLNRGTKLLQNEIAHLEDSRTELYKKYGEVDDKGQITVKKENTELFVKEMNVLLSTEVDVDFTPIDISNLAGIKLSAQEFRSAEKFIDVSAFEKNVAAV